MGRSRSYTARELAQQSGFDRRTIAYYVQKRLLPRVGRRGRRTRYPQLFLHRLLFIRRVREAEESGLVPPVPLSEMREMFERMPPVLIARVAEGRVPVTPELVPGSPGRVQSPPPPPPDLHRAPFGVEQGGPREEPPALSASIPPFEPDAPRAMAPPRARREVLRSRAPASEAPPPASQDADALSDELRAYYGTVPQHGPRPAGPRPAAPRAPDQTVETWSRIRVASGLELLVRGPVDEDEPWLRRIVRILRREAPPR